ncbi:hypothetical protein QU481_14010 [Crenobacter sp. SG2303]|uniref:Uncharacterized protein n=1 Tax=Crenobacter oryzisoli TaxID=3056844 RepID=A0ABT7XQD1_9NEIS|nr:hypothetical protein [Crenobacter sp. SG2303]MDN0076002.1 hypothetical protein [Crenobacter sp. SG2303]
MSAISCGDLSTLKAWELREGEWSTVHPYEVEYPNLPDADLLDTKKTALKTEQVVQWAAKVKLPTYKQTLLRRKREIESEIGTRALPAPAVVREQERQPVALLPGYRTPAIDLLEVHVEQNLAGVPDDQIPSKEDQMEWLTEQAKHRGLSGREAAAVYAVARPEIVKARAASKVVHPKSK